MGCCESRDKDPDKVVNDSKSLPGTPGPEENRNDAVNIPESSTPIPKQQFDTFSNDKTALLFNVEYETPDIEKPEKSTITPVKPVKNNFTVKIYIEALEIIYKFCDDFGSSFKPFIQLIFFDQIQTINTFDEEKLNLSDNNELNKSVENGVNITINSKMMERKFTNITGKEKNYLFKSEVSFTSNDSLFYSSIQIFVKNEFTITNKNSKMEHIIIGEAKIPINLLEKKENERIFDGIVELKLRNITPIGFLKIRVFVNDSDNLEVHNSFTTKRLIDEMENSNDFSGFINKNNSAIFDLKIIHYFELDPSLVDKYFFINKESTATKTKFFEIAQIIINEKNLDGKAMQKYYYEAVKEKNFIVIYEILNNLLKLSILQDFNPIIEFFKMSLIEKEIFFNFCNSINFNAYIVKVYFTFLYYLQVYYKQNKSAIIRNNKLYNDELLIEIIYKSIKKIQDCMKTFVININYSLEIRECVIWAINNLTEVINRPYEKNNDDDKVVLEQESLNQKKKEYTVIYNNCILIMGYRFTFMKLIDSFYNDSQIMSGLYRIFRKATQMITNDVSNFLDKSQLKSSPKDISKMFRNLLVEKYDGMFINSLRIMLRKYNHYPELHFNILIMLFQLVNNLDIKNLYYTILKLNLEEFKDNFNIFRGKIRSFTKLLNSLHLNILAVFSEIIMHEKELTTSDDTIEEFFIVISNIFLDLRSFYRYKKNEVHKLNEFIKRKHNEIDIHETITRIINNLTSREQLASLFWEENLIVDDLLNFLQNICQNTGTKNNFFKTTIERERKNRNIEETKKIILSICENTLNIIFNLFNGVNKSTKPPQFISFIENLIDKYGKREDFIKIFQNLTKVLSLNGLNVVKCDILIKELEKNLNKHW